MIWKIFFEKRELFRKIVRVIQFGVCQIIETDQVFEKIFNQIS